MKATTLFVVAAAAASGLVNADPSPPASEDAFYDDVSASMAAAPVMMATRPPVARLDGPIAPGEFSPKMMILLKRMPPAQRHAVVMQMRHALHREQEEQWQRQLRMQELQLRLRKSQEEEYLRTQCRQLAKEDRLSGLAPPSRGTTGANGVQASRKLSPMEEIEQLNRYYRDAILRRPAPRAPAPRAPWTPKVAFQPIPYKFPPPRVAHAPPPPPPRPALRAPPVFSAPTPRAPPVFAAPVAPPRARTAPINVPVASSPNPLLGQVKLPGMHAPTAATVPLPTDPTQRDQLRARCMRIANADRVKAAVARGSPSAILGARVGVGTGATTTGGSPPTSVPGMSASAPVMTASRPITIARGIIRQPRIHGKPGTGQQAKSWTAGANPVRKRTTVRQTVLMNKPGMPRKRKTTAELLRDRINALPVGSPLRVTYERRLARLQAAKAGGAAGQTPKTRSAGVRTAGAVRKPKTVRKTVVVVNKPGAPRKRKTTAELLRDRINALPVGSPLRVMYERRLARLQAAKSGGAAGQKPKVATTAAPLMSLAGSGYDYASLDDAWDESYDDMWDDAYDGGDFSVEDAYGEDAADDEYDGSDFSVSEDAAYEGDDMWEDSYDGDFAVADEAGPADAMEDAYSGGDFSVDEDAYGGDDLWDDAYDGEGYSVEDTFTEDAADGEY